MKSLSKYEKSIIENIIKLHNDNSALVILDNILDEHINEYYYFEVEQDYTTVMINSEYFNSNFSDGTNFTIESFIKKIRVDLYTAVNLLENLEKRGYIYLAEEREINSLGKITENETYASAEFNDANFSAKLYKYNRRIIIPSSSLLEIVLNGYMTNSEFALHKELLHNKRMFKWTVISVMVTAFSVLLSTFIPVLLKNDDKVISVRVIEDKRADSIKIPKLKLPKLSNNQK